MNKEPLTVGIRIENVEPVIGVLGIVTDLINALDGVALPAGAAEKLAKLQSAMLDAELITPSDVGRLRRWRQGRKRHGFAEGGVVQPSSQEPDAVRVLLP